MKSRSPALDVVVAGASDVGRVRENNEDRVIVGSLDAERILSATELHDGWRGSGDRGPFAVVCDGMGGAHGGEVAAELAAQIVWREIATTPKTGDVEVFARLLRRALRVASAEVYATATRENLRGMGTTAVAAGIVGDQLVIANVGDSRVYVMRGEHLSQVTRDQSLASVMISAGRSETEAASVGGAILQAVGVAADVEPSLSLAQLRRGDRIVLCSDGLHGLLDDDIIQKALLDGRDLAASVDLLINCARIAGGSDNISCVLIEVQGARFAASPPNETPKFREFDPQKEGAPALTSTSLVARRLAARAGVDTDPGPEMLPVTGQHRAFVESTAGRPAPSEARRILARGGVPSWLWLVAATTAAVITWLCLH
ncbi:MAG: serine/threonine-protein phosphatase [Kofleriaceae bacterium]|nr:serine/threonine-protein phosphatase [Kofleriaceae bacterium]